MGFLKNKKFLILLTIVAIILILFYFFKNQGTVTKGLTDQKKFDILNQQAAASSSDTVTDTQKQNVLNQTNTKSKETLSDQDKAQILNGIK